jgi:hypothetical protein
VGSGTHADGADEVHHMVVGRNELKRFRP